MTIVRGTDERIYLRGATSGVLARNRSDDFKEKALEKLMSLVDLSFRITNRLVITSGNLMDASYFEEKASELFEAKYPDVKVVLGDCRKKTRVTSTEKCVVLTIDVYPFSSKNLDCMVIELQDNTISLTYVTPNVNNNSACIHEFDYQEPVLFVVSGDCNGRARRSYINFKAGLNLTKSTEEVNLADINEHLALRTHQVTDEVLAQAEEKFNTVIEVLDVKTNIDSIWSPQFDPSSYYLETRITNLIEDRAVVKKVTVAELEEGLLV